MGEVPMEFNSFLNFERILYWYEIKAYFLENLFLSYFKKQTLNNWYFLSKYLSNAKFWLLQVVQHKPEFFDNSQTVNNSIDEGKLLKYLLNVLSSSQIFFEIFYLYNFSKIYLDSFFLELLPNVNFLNPLRNCLKSL